MVKTSIPDNYPKMKKQKQRCPMKDRVFEGLRTGSVLHISHESEERGADG